MITPVYFVICQNATIDQNSNNVSAFNILERMSYEVKVDSDGSEELPDDAILPLPINMNAVSCWHFAKPTANVDFELQIVDPNGKNLVSEKKSFDLDPSNRRQRINQRVGTMPVTVSGDYLIRHKIKSGKASAVQETLLEINLEKR